MHQTISLLRLRYKKHLVRVGKRSYFDMKHLFWSHKHDWRSPDLPSKISVFEIFFEYSTVSWTEMEILLARQCFWFYSPRLGETPATATAFPCDLGRDLCCWVESVESFGCLAYLMVWWWQKPSACIKADISLRERVARERELQYKLTMAAPVFFIFIAPSRCQPQQSLCPLWHPMAAPLHRMKEKRGGGGQLPSGIRYLNPILRSSGLQWR